MVLITRARLEVEMLVETFGLIVLRMGDERSRADRVGGLRRPEEGVLEECGSYPTALN